MFDQDQLYQAGSLLGHYKSTKNQSEQIEYSKKQIQLLKEQRDLEERRLKAAKDTHDILVLKMESEEKYRQEQDMLSKLNRERLKSVRNILADAGMALDKIEAKFSYLD